MHTTTDILDAIRRHGEATYPEECCGFLLGQADATGNHVDDVVQVENRRAENRERRYTITPDDFVSAERAARARDLDVVGFYHSHPDHPARPSATDLAEATFPGYTYLIVSVRDGAAQDLTAWSLAPDRSRFVPEDVTLDGATSSSPSSASFPSSRTSNEN